CSGSVLTLGILKKVFSSSRNRSWLSRTNASVVGIEHYYTKHCTKPSQSRRRLQPDRPGLGGCGAGEHALHLRSVERLSEHVVGAEVNRLGPKSGIGESVGDHKLGSVLARQR